jgi:hypothetical protein
MEKSELTETEKGETGEKQVKSMLIIFFDFKEIVHKELSWQAKQSIPHIIMTFYSNCVKMCEHFAQNFGNKRTGCCITTHRLTLPFSPGNF